MGPQQAERGAPNPIPVLLGELLVGLLPPLWPDSPSFAALPWAAAAGLVPEESFFLSQHAWPGDT